MKKDVLYINRSLERKTSVSNSYRKENPTIIKYNYCIRTGGTVWTIGEPVEYICWGCWVATCVGPITCRITRTPLGWTTC